MKSIPTFPPARRFALALTLLALVLAALACRAVEFPPQTAEPKPGPGAVTPIIATEENGPAAVPSPLPIEPSAIPEEPTEEPTLAPSPTALPDPAGILPASLYFLAPDAQGITQVWRLARDAVSLFQVTSENLPVDEFAVSQANGRVAYITADNRLVAVDAGGGNLTVLVEGPPNDDTDLWNLTQRIGSPLWTPTGDGLLYAQNGINQIDPLTGSISSILPSDIDLSGVFPFPRAMYSPKAWSPDGSRLLVFIGYYEGGSMGILPRPAGSLLGLSKPDGTINCCQAAWSPDGAFVYVGGYQYGGLTSELWRFDAANGAPAPVVTPEAGDGTLNHADTPLPLPDGSLQYFFTNLASPPPISFPLLMVRSQADGTGRTVLRPESFFYQEALWAPDGSLAVIIQPPVGDPVWPPRGAMAILFTDGQPSRAAAPLAGSPRWGP